MIQLRNKGNLHLYCRYFPFLSSPFWDYTGIFLDIPIHCRVDFHALGICSHDIYTASNLWPESRVASVDTWILLPSFPCPLLHSWQTSLMDHRLSSALPYPVLVLWDLPLNSRRQACRASFTRGMGHCNVEDGQLSLVYQCMPQWQQSMFVLLAEEAWCSEWVQEQFRFLTCVHHTHLIG